MSECSLFLLTYCFRKYLLKWMDSVLFLYFIIIDYRTPSALMEEGKGEGVRTFFEETFNIFKKVVLLYNKNQ